MNPGKLRHRITIQWLPENTDEYNTPEPNSAWQDIKTVWASVEPLHGKEYVQLQNTNAEITTRIKMRYLPGVKPEMLVVYAGRVFDIQSVLDIEEKHKEIHLMCVEKVKADE